MATTALYLSVSAQAHSEVTIDELLAQAQHLEQQMQLGIQSAAGAQMSAYGGEIIANGSVQGYIEQQYVDAYNNAITNVQNRNYRSAADIVIESAINESMDDLHMGVDNLVAAVTEMSEVFAVADLAEEAKAEADTSGNVEQQEALQEYVNVNDVQIQDETVEVYNESLGVIEEAAQSAAVFITAINDNSFMDTLNADINSFNADANTAVVSYMGQNDHLNITFTGANGTAAIDYFGFASYELNAQFVQSSDVLLTGQQTSLFSSFETFRESGGRTNFDSRGNYSIPPNVLVFTGPAWDGGVPDAYTDNNGTIIYYEPGDEVYDPYNNEYIGKWEMNGEFTWDPDAYQRFS